MLEIYEAPTKTRTSDTTLWQDTTLTLMCCVGTKCEWFVQCR